MRQRRMVVFLQLIIVLLYSSHSWSWTHPGHMLSGTITYQTLAKENPAILEEVSTALSKHPWYENRWRNRLKNASNTDHDLVVFMLAARWSDDIRIQDRSQHRGPWHYIASPFKPDGQPDAIRATEPNPDNILTALTLNERIAKTEKDGEKRAIALAWLFHLVGDLHQPLHTVQAFTEDNPQGDRGGNLTCVRRLENSKPATLHRIWDSAAASSHNITRLRNRATLLRGRPEFSRSELTELARDDFASWAREGFEIGVKIAYGNGKIKGTPIGAAKTCADISDAVVLPPSYLQAAGNIAERRVTLAGYRLADILSRIFRN